MRGASIGVKGLVTMAALMVGAAAFGDGHHLRRGQIEVLGRGTASAAPEYASVTAQITSICYGTSRAAKDANAVLANEVVNVMKSFVGSEGEKIVARGGPNVRRTEYVQEGTTSKVICENGWRAENTLILKLTDIASLPDVQDKILAVIDAQGIQAGRIAQTYGELYQPSFHLFEATEKTLRAAAQKQAWNDAKEQYDTFKAQCAFENVKLQSITPPEFRMKPVFAAPEAARTSTPIMPSDLTVSATWKFVWTFDPTSGCAF